MITRRGSAAYGLIVRSKQCKMNESLGSKPNSELYITFLMVQALYSVIQKD
jgi:hypothetical protein